MIGGWREEFATEHERAAEEVAGPLLVELGYETSNPRLAERISLGVDPRTR